MSKKTSKIEIVNIGPVRNFHCEVQPGMNLLTGKNGAGKSATLNAIAKAAGADVNVEVTDGQTQGAVKLDDAVLLTLTRSRTKIDSGVEVSLASVSPLALLIDPGIKDRKAAEQARIKALLQLFELKVTPEVIAELVEGDEAALDLIEEEIGAASFELDPVALAGRLIGAHGILSKRKRELEKRAAEAHGQWQAARPASKPETLPDVTVHEAQIQYDRAVGDYRQIQGEASQRAQREDEREEIRASLGERPDIASALEKHRYAAEDVKIAEDEIALVEGEIRKWQERLIAAKHNLADKLNAQAFAVERLGEAKAAEVQWDRRKAILDSEITGATATDVENAARSVESARATLEAARATEEYQRRLKASEEARQTRERYTELAARYEMLAKGVPARLGGLLAKAGIKSGEISLTVEDGVLQVIRPDGTQESYHRLSAGQRTRIAMPLFIERNPNKIVAFDERFWNSLEAESKEEVAQILAENGVIGLTEVPTARGDELKVEHFEAGE